MPSTVIRQFSYDPDKRVLRVIFVSGMIYDYKDVPEAVYTDMKACREKGIFLNTRIKGKFDFEKVTDVA